MSARSKNKWPELLRDITDKSITVLIDAGIDKSTATDVAHKLAHHIRHDWGGQLVYIPKGGAIDLSERDLDFYKRWNGTPTHLAELSREFGFSVVWGYKIVKTVRAAEKNQRDMF